MTLFPADNSPVVLAVTPRPDGVDECWALDAYHRTPEGRTRVADLFSSAKYQQFGPPLMVLRAMFATAAISVARFRMWPIDLVVVPIASSSRLPFELAKSAADALEVPLHQVFQRPSGPKMKDVPIANRTVNASARAVVTPLATCPPNVLLVDDLVETGSTFGAAARAVRNAGAKRVVAMAAVNIQR